MSKVRICFESMYYINVVLGSLRNGISQIV